MRRPMAAAVLVALAGCGGGGGSGSGPGGGGSLAGTLQGSAFLPVEGSALVVPPTGCPISGGTGYGSALILGFSNFAGLCTFAQQSQICDDKANVVFFTVTVIKAGLTPQTPVGAGTYPVGTSSASLAVDSSYNRTNAACVHSEPVTLTATGTVTISSIGAGRVAGSADVTFSDGSRMAGSFDVPVCSYQADLCAIASGTCTCSTASCCIP